MSESKDDKTVHVGSFTRQFKVDYNIVLKKIDNGELNIAAIRDLSAKNGNAPILIIQNNQLKVYGYNPKENIEPGVFQLQELNFPNGLEDPIVKTFIQSQDTERTIKLGDLSGDMRLQMAKNHQEVRTKRQRVPTVTDKSVLEKIRSGESMKHLHIQARQQHFFAEASLKEAKKQSDLSIHGKYKVPYVKADQGTNYKVRSAEKVYTELKSKGAKIPEPNCKSASITPEENAIPNCVQNFNPQEDHTLFMPCSGKNKNEIVQEKLDMRLGGPLKGVLQSCGHHNQIEAFLGTTEDMISLYQSRGFKMVEEIWFPSTGRYYTFHNPEQGEFVITLGCLQSKANLISQLLTLKMAGVNVDGVKVFGNTQSIENDIKNDILNFKEKLEAAGIDLKESNSALVIAGNGGLLANKIEGLGNDIDKASKIESAPGSKCSMTYYPIKDADGKVTGIINLSMPYGEVMGPMLTHMAEHLKVREVFLAGIGGAIGEAGKPLKEDVVEEHIGTYHVFFKTTNPETGEEFVLEADEVILPPEEYKDQGYWLNDENKGVHVHVDSPFIETFSWLNSRVKEECTMVDCESHFAIKRIKEWNENNPDDKIRIMPGLLVSDYVGHKSLGALTPETCKHVQPFLESFVTTVKKPKNTLENEETPDSPKITS